MKNKEYARYGMKRFALYMIIGVIISFIPMSYMSAIFAFASIFVAASLLATADAFRLKAIEESGKNSHEVFSKHGLIAIVGAVLISGCYNILFFSVRPELSIFSLMAIAIMASIMLMAIFPIFIYFWTRNKK